MEDFVSFETAKKLKEKGFAIPTKSIFGMYNEIGVFHTLTTSADYETCDSGFKCRCYYNYDDFDERDFIAPTISQVLKWLREEKRLHIAIDIWGRTWGYDIIELTSDNSLHWTAYREDIKSYEDAALAGIEHAIDNLI